MAIRVHAQKAHYKEVFTNGRAYFDAHKRSENTMITFGEKDEEGILRPHDDALVITMQVANFTTRRILVDNGSSTDILLWEAFVRMRISPDRLRQALMPLKGFTGDIVQLMGVVTLPSLLISCL